LAKRLNGTGVMAESLCTFHHTVKICDMTARVLTLPTCMANDVIVE
jgi:hypothetical protein